MSPVWKREVGSGRKSRGRSCAGEIDGTQCPGHLTKHHDSRQVFWLTEDMHTGRIPTQSRDAGPHDPFTPSHPSAARGRWRDNGIV